MELLSEAYAFSPPAVQTQTLLSFHLWCFYCHFQSSLSSSGLALKTHKLVQQIQAQMTCVVTKFGTDGIVWNLENFLNHCFQQSFFYYFILFGATSGAAMTHFLFKKITLQ